MTYSQSIPLGDVPDWFDCAGLDMEELLGALIQRWSRIDTSIHYELTCNFINNEMGLDEDDAEDFLDGTVNELVRVGADIRIAIETCRLLAFTVSRYVVLLTFSEELCFPPPPTSTYIPPLRATRMTVPVNEEKQEASGKVVVAVLVEGKVIIGRRDSLRRLKLLRDDAPAEIPISYFRDAWIMVYETTDELDPPLVYSATKEGVIPLMEWLGKRYSGSLVTLEAGIRGIKSLLERPTESPMVKAHLNGMSLYGQEADFQELGLTTTVFGRPDDLFTDYHLKVSIKNGNPMVFWSADADLLGMMAQSLSLLAPVFAVSIMEGEEPRDVWHHGKQIDPPN